MLPNYNVYVLANRPGPFNDLAVPANAGFTPLTLSADEQAVHDGLYLGYADTDFYLTAYFSAVLSMPDIQRYFSNPTTFDLSRTFPTGAVVVGGSFLNNPKARSFYTGNDASLPLGFNYTITYSAPGTALLTCAEKNISSYALCQTLGTAPSQILRITWPDGWPFVGLIQLTGQTWGPGAEVDINVRPHNFPFYTILQSVQYLPYAMQVVQSMQLDSEYHQAIDSVEKIAYLLVAILLDRKIKISQAAQIGI
jgi:hypothetical protein